MRGEDKVPAGAWPPSQAEWDEIVDRYTWLLWVVARRRGLSRQDAADAVQTTWLRLVENLDRIRDPERIGAWLVVTCGRESTRVAKVAGLATPRDMSSEDGAWRDESAEDPADLAVRHEERRVLREAVESLPERQRLLVTELLDGLDRHQDGWAGAAKRLRVPAGSLGPTRQRAIVRLRRDRRLRNLR